MPIADLTVKTGKRLNDDILLKIASFDLHTAGMFACLSRDWRDKMEPKLSAAKGQLSIVREWKDEIRFTKMAKELKICKQADHPQSLFYGVSKASVQNVEAEPVKFIKCWWEYDCKIPQDHRYLPDILGRALFGIHVAIAICLVEKLDRYYEVCTTVFRATKDILKECGMSLSSPETFVTVEERLCREIDALKEAKAKGHYRSFRFGEYPLKLRGKSSLTSDKFGQRIAKFIGIKRSSRVLPAAASPVPNIEQILTPVFYRLLTMWERLLPDSVLALVAHASACLYGQ